MVIRHLIHGLALVLLAPSWLATAAEFAGPNVTLRSMPASHDTQWAALLPIPHPIANGMLALTTAGLMRETGPRPIDENLPENSVGRVWGAGIQYLHHAKEGAPRFYVELGRYGRVDPSAPGAPMTEVIIGTNLDAEDVPFAIRPQQSDEAKLRLRLQMRRFPAFTRWRPSLGWEWSHPQDGVFMKVSIPDQIAVGWRSPSGSRETWRMEAGIYQVDVHYPRRLAMLPGDEDLRLQEPAADLKDQYEVAGWQDGERLMLQTKLGRQIGGSWFLSFLAGYAEEDDRLITLDGRTINREQIAAPFIGMSLESWRSTW